ncbi:hypothetical protein OJAV_G00125230 [Oryzias javanicus]|uniref:RING-type E3 ubiquitin transferase n=1 Tax=Oryzias javanicus TaxID=123683 RepID=A0A437CNJ7_ORYJA|nr:hypothetical protein OJAV_G00125230 [Oryzias javanicus]
MLYPPFRMMSAAWSGEDSFACPVCLDILKDPTTLPCGHSYCLSCIQSHWDKERSKGQYSCPQCRQVFNPRPPLARSTVLAEAMEKLRTGSFRESSSSAAAPSAPPSMPIYLEVLPALQPRKDSVYPQLPPVEPKLCPQHTRPLDLFCLEDKECVCEGCCQYGHKGHRVSKQKDERNERQKEIVQMQAEVQRRIQETEKNLSMLPHAARQHKAMMQALERESSGVFSELVKNLTQTGAEISELLGSHESSLGNDVEGQIQRFEQEVAQLHWRSEELSRLADMQDNVCFLKNFFLMEPLEPKDAAAGSVLSQEEAIVTSLRSVIKELQESIRDVSKTSIDKIVKLVNCKSVAPTPNGVPAAEAAAAPELPDCPGGATASAAESTNPPPLPPLRTLPRTQVMEPPRMGRSASHQVSPSSAPFLPPRPRASLNVPGGYMNPEPKTREEMLKYRFEPTLDPNTAYRHVHVSDHHKAILKGENLNPPDHPDRFTFWRQVLCKEPLAGSPYYWEVEWTGKKVTIGVAYKEMARDTTDNSSRLGHNGLSWGLYWSGTGFSFWHNNQEKLLGAPKARRIGIYLDQHVGVLSFHSVANNKATLIHRHQTQFTGALYPGFRFWSGVGDTVTICQLD